MVAPGGGRAWDTTRYGDTVNERAVRILLECILVVFQLGNHDQSRVATRLGEKYVNAANMMALLLPGTATTYYGEEIGMVDGIIDWSDAKDPVGTKFGEVSIIY